MTHPLHLQLVPTRKRATPSALASTGPPCFPETPPPSVYRQPGGGWIRPCLVIRPSYSSSSPIILIYQLVVAPADITSWGAAANEKSIQAPEVGVTRYLPSCVQYPASTRTIRATPSQPCPVECLSVRVSLSHRNLRGADRQKLLFAAVPTPPFSLRTMVALRGHPC